MNHIPFILTLASTFLLSSAAQAFIGPAPSGTAIAQYDSFTGEITVSVNGVNNWFIQSASHGLTGDAPLGIPTVGNLLSDNDVIIGETGLATFSYTDIDLGAVAQTALSLADLTISWNAGLGEPLLTTPLGYLHLSNDVPSASIDGPLTIDIATDPLSVTLDASNTTHFIPVIYLWDLDNDGHFEVDTGFENNLPIANVTNTFGGVGSYPIAMKAFNGVASDIAMTTLTIINTPEPNTLILAGILSSLGMTIRRRRPVC